MGSPGFKVAAEPRRLGQRAPHDGVSPSRRDAREVVERLMECAVGAWTSTPGVYEPLDDLGKRHGPVPRARAESRMGARIVPPPSIEHAAGKRDRHVVAGDRRLVVIKQRQRVGRRGVDHGVLAAGDVGARVPVGVEGSLVLQDGVLRFEPDRAEAFGASIPQRLLRGADFSYPVSELPFGRALSNVEVHKDGLVLSGEVALSVG